MLSFCWMLRIMLPGSTYHQGSEIAIAGSPPTFCACLKVHRSIRKAHAYAKILTDSDLSARLWCCRRFQSCRKPFSWRMGTDHSGRSRRNGQCPFAKKRVSCSSGSDDSTKDEQTNQNL